MMKTMFILFFGAIGGVFRYLLESAIHLSSGFPLATLIINLTDSFTLGLF
ncbi:CrcB family protein [Alicyclobacillus curvatus]|nr:CrcB family protein [Alicyclobacillus curvatus]